MARSAAKAGVKALNAAPAEAPRPYVRRVLVARPRGKQGSGVALDRPEPSPKLSEGGP